MPKRTDIKSILILGAGPIIIGQACEFDYSGTQACKALREDGYRLIVVNSNPSTIMTDPDMADVTYIEPIHWKVLSKIIEKERPDTLLPTVGGQTALNCALDLDREGILKKYHVELIGATSCSIIKAEDRQLFRSSMKKIGLQTARSGLARSMDEALLILKAIGLPCIIRPSFTLGGSGGGVAHTEKEFRDLCESGFDISPNSEILIDESLIGWKEYEMEVVRDKNDNCIIVCSIENVDPMGIHTGDSITVAPAQTLTDKEYQIMRNASIAVLREIGVETGGSNVQFSINPITGQFVIVEMNPRVSRSSALASKATGFPIAKVAAKLAVGYTLDELMNDLIGGCIPASFEPTIDYVVTKIPRFDFDKFDGAKNRLTTQMKSIGEVMAIGCTQQESLQKALRALEIGSTGFDSKINLNNIKESMDIVYYELKYPGPDRIWYVADAFRIGMSLEEIFNLTRIDRWFLAQIEELVFLENNVISGGVSILTVDYLRVLKSKGFSDARLGILVGLSENKIRDLRNRYGLYPAYKKVDTCAAEFFANSICMYSTYSGEHEQNCNRSFEKIMILGSGPNRIGQGIEFDYCCVHAVLAFRELGYKTIMINCNPETVSTDYDIADYLYFEPITLEDVLEVIRVEMPQGVIIQYGGQTPLKLSHELELNGVNIIGTSVDSIDRAENRRRFQEAIRSLGLKQPRNASVTSLDLAVKSANHIGYPLVIRPSYVLGGRAMEIVYNEEDLLHYFHNAVCVSYDSPVLLDQFIENAIEIDVDAICDGENVLIGGIMEHVEQAGIHSGDSACSLPAYTLSTEMLNIIRNQVRLIAFDFRVHGLVNIQFAIKNREVYLLEVNPRASRTVPFVSKAIGLSLAKVSAAVLIGESLFKQDAINEIIPHYFSVKEVLLPFLKFPDIDPILGPEMRSTGEVMGFGSTFYEAFSKAMLASSSYVKKSGCVLLSVFHEDHARLINLIIQLFNYGFSVDVTNKTAFVLKEAGFYSNIINCVEESSIYVYNKIKNGGYSYIIDTVSGHKKFMSTSSCSLICRLALQHKVCYSTTLNASFATLLSLDFNPVEKVVSIQEMHSQLCDFIC